MFDAAIDNWHDFFGLPRANRPFVEHNQYDIRYTTRGQNLVDLDQPSTSLGDIQLAAARSIITENDRQLSFWAGLKLPSGDKNNLSSNGTTDFSAWLALNQQLAESWLINLNAGSVIPGSSHYQNMALSDYVFYGHVMLGWLLTEHINLKVQLQGHTSYYDDSQLTILGDTYFLTFGAAIKLNRCQQIDFAINEDIKVEASPDASMLISWRSYTSSC